MNKLDEILNEYYPVHSFASEIGEKIRMEAKLAILKLMEQVVAEFKPAHTYGSENADIYRAYDNGFKDCQKQTLDNIKELRK